MKKGTKGITLIALVITIIVLLILAGITIATLTGENGVLTKANESKEKTTKAGAYEKVEMAVAGSIGEDGELDYDELEKNLNKVEGIDKSTVPNEITKESFPFTVRVDGIDVEIREDGRTQIAFNAEEWDKTAASEDCFVWGSDKEGEEGYNIVVGYNSKIQDYTKLKFPSRCQKIEIGKSYSNIGDANSRSFGSSVKKIELPNTLIEIGDSAFTSCDYKVGMGFDSLENVIIPDSVTSIGNAAFWNCQKLKEINIPNSVTSIGSQVFCKCTSLTNVTIPNSVTSIGHSTFLNCQKLKEINIPNSVTSIGNSAFEGTAWYNSQPDGLLYIGKVAYKYKGTMPENTSIEIKEGTTQIGYSAFGGCTSLTNITIPNSVKSIGSYAFYGCTNLQTINVKGYKEKPEGWDKDWNMNCNATVNWGQ